MPVQAWRPTLTKTLPSTTPFPMKPHFRTIFRGKCLNRLKSDFLSVTMPYVPEQNGCAERFVRSIKKECLDHLIFLGEKSLRRAVNEFVKHYHHERNHQGLDNLIPMPYIDQNRDEERPIVKSERLGGLLNYYYRESENENGKEEARAA